MLCDFNKYVGLLDR